MKVSKKRNNSFRQMIRRSSSLSSIIEAGQLKGIEEEEDKGVLPNTNAKELDMDHIFLKFSDFLWGYTFIGTFSYILWLRGTFVLRFRKFLQKIGLIDPMAHCDYEALAATLLLEQTQVINYIARPEEGNVAGFFFTDFPWVDQNCDMQIAKLFSVKVDLNTKRFVTAKFNDEEISAKEAVILLWFNTIGAQHVKRKWNPLFVRFYHPKLTPSAVHSMANWGVNVDDSLEGTNPFFRRNSIVTVMYNYFGYTCFNTFMNNWAKQGLVSKGWVYKAPLLDTFNFGIKSGISEHAHIDQLTKYSRFVKFVIKVRAIFMSEFAKYKKDHFPGVNGEAMFVGTILHSLDHTLADMNLKEPLYLDTADARFGKMAEMGQVVKAGFVSDLDGLYFHKRFKNSGHPFYDSVYEKAAKIDMLFADNMDTCIVK
ncbi:hypothetical protein ACHAWF_010586 [Thalassiosira exigua]